MIAKELKITNSNGDSIQFGHHFRLLEGFDLSNLSADVIYVESTRDGANYQRTVLDVREFDIAFYIARNRIDDYQFEELKREAFRVFNPKHNPMRLDFKTIADEAYYLQANIESTPSFPHGFTNENKSWQRGLLQFTCNDPYIYNANSNLVDIAIWVGAFEFPLEMVEGGIEMGYRSESLIANVYNEGDLETGMIIRFKALASLSNPSLINVNTYEQLKLKVNMTGGDLIEVSTYVGNKTVTLIRNNVRTDIFNSVDLRSKFLQLEPGDNLFRYDAESGLENLEVSMLFTPRYVGV